MELNDVLTALEYRGSPNFLQGQSLEADRDFGHIFRKAKIECGLQGVYVLNGSSFEKSRGTVPVVYVCKVLQRLRPGKFTSRSESKRCTLPSGGQPQMGAAVPGIPLST